ncbi:hypothetical protein ACFVUS_29870 [Nocardia sp. NPDC058058]|uniref:hypothetical protein n=1 Tax=Nocardia sp. NPDC058058 TaxID=3346317 RepID=UPI0036DADAD9
MDMSSHAKPQINPQQGAVAAFVMLAGAVTDIDPWRFPEEYRLHCHRIRQLAPLVRASGLLGVMSPNTPLIATLLMLPEYPASALMEHV